MNQHNSKWGWTKFSENRLIEVENTMLNTVKTTYKTWFVSIGSTIGKDDKIWTILLNEDFKNTPLVLLHGFAAGLCFWCMNYDHIAKDRPVYAIDLLGFGRSSRPNFSNNYTEAEQQMVQAIEEWRKKVGLDKFILLGHSFGGYLATSYTINYPERIKHLILADPWGFTEKPAKIEAPLRIRVLRFVLYPLILLNPLATIRAAGPCGPWIVNKVRGDISRKYEGVVENKEVISEYIYHCNAQKPSGESAFHNMQNLAYAKNPMIHRFHLVQNDIPVSVLYGDKSWLMQLPEDVFKEKRPESYLSITFIKNAGHHIYSDQPNIFNEVVKSICRITDDGSYTEKITATNEVIDSQPNIIRITENIEIEFQKNMEVLTLNENLNSMEIVNDKM